MVEKRYPENIFCWIDFAAKDVAAAKTFYSGLFGWEMQDMPVGDDMYYTMCTLEGEAVCAMYNMLDDMRAMGVPAHWANYVNVADVDATLAKAVAAGATSPKDAFDVFTAGRMAVMQDPTGAWLNLWQPRDSVGATIVNRPNTWSWSELATTDIARAREFYESLFGWKTNVYDGPKGDYISITSNDRPVGGMLEIMPEWGQVPSNWSVYFSVEDCAAACARVVELGGTIAMPEMQIPDIGTMAVVSDDQGAYFSVIALLNADSPPWE